MGPQNNIKHRTRETFCAFSFLDDETRQDLGIPKSRKSLSNLQELKNRKLKDCTLK